MILKWHSRMNNRFGQIVVLVGLAAAIVLGMAIPLGRTFAGPGDGMNALGDCESPFSSGVLSWCVPEPAQTPVPGGNSSPLRGMTSLANPATGQFLVGTDDDPLAAFAQRPFDNYIIPEGGLYLDPLHDGLHYGVDYANADDYLNGRATVFSPVGPGYVTARSTCIMCFVDGDQHGRVNWKWPQYNFGWGTLVLVETPLNPKVSIYVLYAHLALDFVSLGDYVTPEDALGYVGTSGYSENSHVHVEVRFGAPGRFWNADFSQWPTLDRWMAMTVANPAHLILPESHPALITSINEWLSLQPSAATIP